MKTADLIRNQLRFLKTPGKPVDTDTLIEAIGNAMDIKLSRSEKAARQPEDG